MLFDQSGATCCNLIEFKIQNRRQKLEIFSSTKMEVEGIFF